MIFEEEIIGIRDFFLSRDVIPQYSKFLESKLFLNKSIERNEKFVENKLNI